MVFSPLKFLIPARTRKRVGDVTRRFSHLGRKGAWAAVDQGMVSLGNFVTQFMLARHLKVEEYGAFGILFELMVFLNAVHGSIVTYPLTVRGAVAEQMGLRRLSGTSVLLTGFIAPLLGLAIVVMAAMSGRIELAIWATLALAGGQVQETFRRTLLASIGYREAVLGDTVSYLGQALLIFALVVTNHLTIVTAFQAMALSSFVAVAVQWIQVRPVKSEISKAVLFLREGWTMSRWIFFANFTTLLTGTGFIWNLSYWQGLHDVGVYSGLTNILRFSNPLVITLCNVLIPTIVRARENSGLEVAKRTYFKYAGVGFVLVLMLFATPLIAPTFTLRLFYGPNSAFESHADLLRLMLAAQMLAYVWAMTGAFFNAIEQSRVAFYGQLVYTAVIVCVAYPLARIDMRAAVVGSIIACLTYVAYLAFMFHKLHGERRSVIDKGAAETTGRVSVAAAASPSAAT